MRILLTGASGMVGRNIAEAAGNQYELLMPSHKELNLLDGEAVRSYLHTKQPEMVIHAAGRVGGIALNSKYPLQFMLENIEIGRNVIYNSQREGIKKLINLGSSCIYPANQEKPLAEEMILTGLLEPANEGYALAKVVCAKMCSYISKDYPGFWYKTIVPCNLYGKYDKFTVDGAHMIPAAIHKVYRAKAAAKECVSIWGSGLARREVMYAGDLADCILYAIEHFDRMPNIMNVGTGEDYSIDGYYEIVAEIIGYNGKFSYDLSMPEGIRHRLLDVTKMKEFGWKPKHTLRQGLEETFAFYRKHVCKGA